MRILSSIILTLIVVMTGAVARAQRRVTPVNNAATTTQAINENKAASDTLDRSKLLQFRDDKGNIVLVDTITGTEIIDSTAMPVVPPMKYPLIFETSAGLNLWDPLMRAFGQSHGLVGIQLDFNMHNRYIPVLELGVGMAKDTPANNNYTYYTPVSPYFKIGMDYNFLYNSNPDYRVFAGVRYGFTPFKWTLQDVTTTNNYWGEPSEIPFPKINATVGYFEFLFGLRVKLFRNISMGWTVRYHAILHESPKTHGRAWYIPGYGTNTSPLAASLSVFYTLPLDKRKKETVALPFDTGSSGDMTPETADGMTPFRATEAETTDIPDDR